MPHFITQPAFISARCFLIWPNKNKSAFPVILPIFDLLIKDFSILFFQWKIAPNPGFQPPKIWKKKFPDFPWWLSPDLDTNFPAHFQHLAWSFIWSMKSLAQHFQTKIMAFFFSLQIISIWKKCSLTFEKQKEFTDFLCTLDISRFSLNFLCHGNPENSIYIFWLETTIFNANMNTVPMWSSLTIITSDPGHENGYSGYKYGCPTGITRTNLVSHTFFSEWLVLTLVWHVCLPFTNISNSSQ